MSSDSKEKNSNIKFILIGVALLVVLGLFFLLSGSDKEEPVVEVTPPTIDTVVIPEPEPEPEPILVPEPEPVIETKPAITAPPKATQEVKIKPAPSEEEQAKIEAQEKKRVQRSFINTLQDSPTQVIGGSGVIVDQIITPTFIENIGFYFVEHYIPPAKGRTTGEVTIHPEMINTYYGVDLNGLPGSGNAYYVRELLLDFVYQPANFNTLYLLYSEKLIDDMLRASSYSTSERPAYTIEQQESLLFDYAKYFFSAGHSVQTILNMPNLDQIFASKNELEASLAKNRTRFATVQTSYEEANMNEDYDTANRLREELVLLADMIGSDQAALATLHDQVIFAHGSSDKQVFPENDLIFIFDWLGRRHSQNPENFMSASRDLEDAAFKLSADFVTKAKLLQ